MSNIRNFSAKLEEEVPSIGRMFSAILEPKISTRPTQSEGNSPLSTKFG